MASLGQIHRKGKRPVCYWGGSSPLILIPLTLSRDPFSCPILSLFSARKICFAFKGRNWREVWKPEGNASVLSCSKQETSRMIYKRDICSEFRLYSMLWLNCSRRLSEKTVRKGTAWLSFPCPLGCMFSWNMLNYLEVAFFFLRCSFFNQLQCFQTLATSHFVRPMWRSQTAWVVGDSLLHPAIKPSLKMHSLVRTAIWAD